MESRSLTSIETKCRGVKGLERKPVLRKKNSELIIATSYSDKTQDVSCRYAKKNGLNFRCMLGGEKQELDNKICIYSRSL